MKKIGKMDFVKKKRGNSMNENEQKMAENMPANGTVPAPAYVGKEYKLGSVRGTFFTVAGSGIIRNKVVFDQEKMTIETQPAKKSTIPVLYYADITSVIVNRQMTWYTIFWTVASIAFCFVFPVAVLFAGYWLWKGANRKITITLRSGSQAVLYGRKKKVVEELVQDIKTAAEI